MIPVVPESYSEDTDILQRLITAIRKKVEEEEEGLKETHNKSEGGKKEKKYSIGDKASVLARLSGIVHPVQLDGAVHTRG